MSQSSASRWERGDVPPLAQLAVISKVLGIPLKVLAAYERPGAPTLADRARELGELSKTLSDEVSELRRMIEALAKQRR